MIVKFLLKLFYLFPINKKKIYLRSFYNKYCLDIKAIGDYLNTKHKGEFKIILGLDNNNNIDNPNIKCVKEKSITGIFNMLTSGTVIYSIKTPKFIPFRKSQILINTWHGNGFKRGEKAYTKEMFSDATYFTAYSKKYEENVIRNIFKYDGKIIRCGAPKNDIFFDITKINAVKYKVEKYFNIVNKKILLYAPTFRGNFENLDYDLDFSLLLKTLKNKFNGDWVILFRVHPSLANKVDFKNDNILNASNYIDMQELLAASDILITDYSSTPWDFGIQRKPIFIYAPDIDKYNNERGLLLPIEEWPYLWSSTNRGLSNIILNFDFEKYKERLDKYYLDEESYERGNACEIIYKYIKQKN